MDPPSIVNVSNEGHVTPLANGSVKITAKTSEGVSAQIELTVEQNVIAGTITSSFFFKLRAFKLKCKAAVHEFTALEKFICL